MILRPALAVLALLGVASPAGAQDQVPLPPGWITIVQLTPRPARNGTNLEVWGWTSLPEGARVLAGVRHPACRGASVALPVRAGGGFSGQVSLALPLPPDVYLVEALYSPDHQEPAMQEKLAAAGLTRAFFVCAPYAVGSEAERAQRRASLLLEYNARLKRLEELEGMARPALEKLLRERLGNPGEEPGPDVTGPVEAAMASFQTFQSPADPSVVRMFPEIHDRLEDLGSKYARLAADLLAARAEAGARPAPLRRKEEIEASPEWRFLAASLSQFELETAGLKRDLEFENRTPGRGRLLAALERGRAEWQSAESLFGADAARREPLVAAWKTRWRGEVEGLRSDFRRYDEAVFRADYPYIAWLWEDMVDHLEDALSLYDEALSKGESRPKRAEEVLHHFHMYLVGFANSLANPDTVREALKAQPADQWPPKRRHRHKQ